MTFEEVSKKFPLYCAIGDFNIFARTEKEVTYRLDSYSQHNDHFFSYNPQEQKFYELYFMYIQCDGYVTLDGKDFHAYGIEEDYSLMYLDEREEGCFIDSEIMLDVSTDRYFDLIENYFKQRFPESKIIRCKKDLLQVKQYEF